MSDDKVIFLAFNNRHVVSEEIAYLACRECRNKTFTHTFENGSEFPLAKCAACGSHIGHFGWAEETTT